MPGRERLPGPRRGGEAVHRRAVPRHRRALPGVVAAGAVLHSNLLAVIEEGRPGQREQHLRSRPQLAGVVLEHRRHARHVVVGEERHVGGAGRVELLDLAQRLAQQRGVAGLDRFDDRAGEREVEVERQLVAARDHLGRAVPGRDVRGVGPVLADQRRLGLHRADVGGELLPERVALGAVALPRAGAGFDQVAGGVEPEPVDAAVEPELGDPLGLLADRGRAEVEVGHPAPEERVVPGAVLLVPGGAFGVPRLWPVELVVAPDVPVALGVGLRG